MLWLALSDSPSLAVQLRRRGVGAGCTVSISHRRGSGNVCGVPRGLANQRAAWRCCYHWSRTAPQARRPASPGARRPAGDRRVPSEHTRKPAWQLGTQNLEQRRCQT